MKAGVFRYALVLAALLAGCVEASDEVKVRAANDFSCDAEHIEVTGIGGGAYRADGCGRSRVYDCLHAGPRDGGAGLAIRRLEALAE